MNQPAPVRQASIPPVWYDRRRNVLVRDYLTIDHGIAYRAIRDDLGDLDAFRRRALGKLNV